MTIFNQRFTRSVVFSAILASFAGTTANAAESNDSILDEYTTNGFECLDISQTVNQDTLTSYTELSSLEMVKLGPPI